MFHMLREDFPNASEKLEAAAWIYINCTASVEMIQHLPKFHIWPPLGFRNYCSISVKFHQHISALFIITTKRWKPGQVQKPLASGLHDVDAQLKVFTEK